MSGRGSGNGAALAFAGRLTSAIAERCGVRLDPRAVLDRSDSLALRAAGDLVSPNGSCRLLRAADGWIAVNLPRADDLDLVPAWTGGDFADEAWEAVAAAAQGEAAEAFVARGADLGLAVARLGEAAASGPAAHRLGEAVSPKARLRVLDLSALWAGPLCAGVLAAAGHEVLKVESATRPDPVARSTPALDARLNGLKRRATIPFDRAGLEPLLAEADVVVTSARPRAFAALGLAPEMLLAKRPGLVWIAITGHGWSGPGAGRTGFGDDAAVAGGLVEWSGNEPRFAGDALADPLTGLAAALAGLEAIAAGGGVLVDASMSATAARAAVEP